MKYKYFLSLLFLAFLVSCKPDDGKKVAQENIKVKIPAFSGQSAYDLVKAQVDMGTRHPGSEASKKAIKWMRSNLKSYGWEVSLQTFKTALYTGEQVEGTNIVARYNPHVKERVLLCAHWDTRMIADKDTTRMDEPIPGANDGASGVAVLLEIARTISKNPIPMAVDIVLFDLEDQGDDGGTDEYSWCLGSQYWASHLPEKPYHVKYGILLDMVGAKDAEFPKEGFSMTYAPEVVNKVWGVAKLLNKQKYFVDDLIGGITDDHRFLIQYAKFPAIDIIHHKNDQFMEEHHTHADGMDIIDKNTLQAVGQVVLATIYKESNKEL
jgi:hypothetical protein